MAQPSPTETVDEKRDPTELSIGGIVAWLVGVLTILAAVASIAQGVMIGGSIVLFVAGIFGLPPTRKMIEEELNVRFSRWLAILVYLILLMVAGGVGA
ncbi:hypothetical protein HYG81_06215 [Natrinema zhouii]|uniref:Uncharacterized protein n=1 Tax=Natrinema zhouii TaxID=1710539 RepID=A0A7D6CQC5_9EURY|nr:hypothetical protein [Natrinema zhouii]QLK27195.1 hypothetical protein HYG81_06215 [Natrinema zhouii]